MLSPDGREVIRLFLNEPGRLPVRRALPKKPATPARPRQSQPRPSAPAATTPEHVFRTAVRAVPSPGSHASLAEAFDEAKRKYHHDPRYGTPLALPERAPVGKSTGSTFTDVVGHAIQGARR